MAQVTETQTTPTQPKTTKLWLRSFDDSGFTYRDVSTLPPRDCTSEEIPIIDLSGIRGDLDEQTAVSKQLLHAAETTGFFYITNHGIPEDVLKNAYQNTQAYVYNYLGTSFGHPETLLTSMPVFLDYP